MKWSIDRLFVWLELCKPKPKKKNQNTKLKCFIRNFVEKQHDYLIYNHFIWFCFLFAFYAYLVDVIINIQFCVYKQGYPSCVWNKNKITGNWFPMKVFEHNFFLQFFRINLNKFAVRYWHWLVILWYGRMTRRQFI